MKILSSILKVVTAICFLVGFNGNVFASAVGTQVSPSTINLEAVGVNVVTMHTTIPYINVNAETLEVTLTDAKNDFYPSLPIAEIQEDNLGHLVIKINWAEFTDNYTPALGVATFEFSGYTLPPVEPFEGADEVRIVSNKK